MSEDQRPRTRTVPTAAAGAAARRYDEVWRDVYGDMQELGPVHRHLRRLLGAVLADLRYADALEVGCGAGHNLALLAGDRPASAIAGADVSPEALRRARGRHDGELLELDVERAALPRTWDLVFSSLVLEHLADDESALNHMRAMTRRHVVVATIAGDRERYLPYEDQVGHVRNYRRGELEAKLERAGLAVRRAIYWGFPFYSPLTRRAQRRWRPEPSFGPGARIAAHALHALYRLNSSRRGDLLIVHAQVAD
jgi:SAM-dependent methyltransferase